MPLRSVNPATGTTLRRYRLHTPRQLAASLSRAHSAHLTWRELALPHRAAHLKAIARRLRAERDDLAALITAEMGKPLAQARQEIEKCAGACAFYAKNGARFLRSHRPPGAPAHSRVVYVPLGVVLSIMPWNFPFWQIFRAAAPALLAGNTFLVKPAANTTGCALAIEALLARAGLPAAVYQTLLTEPQALAPLIADPRVRLITLTGSTHAGKQVAALAGAALKPGIYELGGADSYLILADADIAHAAHTLATGRLLNGGQSCISAKRLIVVESVRAEFEKRLVAAFARLTPGDPTAPATELGPLASPDIRLTLHAQVQAALTAGAQLLLGGAIPPGPGYFYPPTVLTAVAPGNPAYAEELFGPVAVIIPVPDEAAALAAANATPYGLGGGVFTRNRRRGTEIARHHLDCGMAFVNDYVRSSPQLPFGGTKESGHGRELGREGILAMVNTKTIAVK